MRVVAQAYAAATSPSVTKGRGLQLLLLTVAITAAVYAKMALGPLQESMRVALLLSDNQMALLQGPAMAIAMVALAVPLGLTIDRESRVRLLLLMLTLVTIGSLLTSVSSNFAVLFAARALVGLGVFPIEPITLSLIADLYAPEQRGRASMVLLAGQFSGLAAVFAVGGTLVTMFGSGEDAWHWALFWLTVPVLTLVILLMCGLREPPRTECRGRNPSMRESFEEFWQRRGVVATLMSGGVFAIVAIQSMMIWTTPTLARMFDLPPNRVGAIVAVVLPLGGVVGTVASSLIADACQRTAGPRRTILVACVLALLGIPLSVINMMPDVMSASVLIVLLLAVLVATAHMATMLAIVVIPNELRGLCLSVFGGVGAIVGVGLGPLLVSMLSGAMGGPARIGQALSVVCVAACMLSGAAFAVGRRYLPRSSLR